MEDSAAHYDYVLKLIIVGNASVGKTALLRRFEDPMASMDTHTTLGVEFKILTFNFQDLGKVVKLQVWDTAGQERFNSLVPTYFRGANCVFLVFAVNDRASFENARSKWMKDIEDHGTEPLMMLVGNKCDLPNEERQVTHEEAQSFADKHKLRYMETSALENRNVQEVFRLIALEGATSIMKSVKDNGDMVYLEPQNGDMDYEEYARMSRQIKRETCGC